MSLISFLSSLNDEDAEKGRLAAHNLEHTRAVFRDDPEKAMGRLSYDIGGKGIHDWVWSPSNLSVITEYTEALRTLLTTEEPKTSEKPFRQSSLPGMESK